MTCGLCGSGICADEKFKKYKNGTITRYVYYGCTKARGADCKCGYTEEKDILKQFEELIEKIDINEIQIKEKIKADVERFTKLQRFLLGTKEKINIPSIDVRGYAKYVLREGSDIEKRELLGCIKGKIILKQKQISLFK
jgi:V8-like Glu-specific endopeptidase